MDLAEVDQRLASLGEQVGDGSREAARGLIRTGLDLDAVDALLAALRSDVRPREVRGEGSSMSAAHHVPPSEPRVPNAESGTATQRGAVEPEEGEEAPEAESQAAPSPPSSSPPSFSTVEAQPRAGAQRIPSLRSSAPLEPEPPDPFREVPEQETALFTQADIAAIRRANSAPPPPVAKAPPFPEPDTESEEIIVEDGDLEILLEDDEDDSTLMSSADSVEETLPTETASAYDEEDDADERGFFKKLLG